MLQATHAVERPAMRPAALNAAVTDGAAAVWLFGAVQLVRSVFPADVAANGAER